MCRSKDTKTKNKYCDLIDDNPSTWDKSSPLSPRIFDSHVESFLEAVELWNAGKTTQCKSLLKKIKEKDDQIQTWYIKHAQVSGRNRNRILKESPDYKAPILDKSIKLDPIRKPSKELEHEILKDDNYHCRYCGIKLIPADFFKQFSSKLNSPELFKFEKGNTGKSGIALITLPVIDHVHPWHLGGQTDKSNLVSSCWPCNYGKHNFTCDEIGIVNPLILSSPKKSSTPS